VSANFHATALASQRKEPQYPLDRLGGPMAGLDVLEKILPPTEIQTSAFPSFVKHHSLKAYGRVEVIDRHS
jgi:hypothetical protein